MFGLKLNKYEELSPTLWAFKGHLNRNIITETI